MPNMENFLAHFQEYLILGLLGALFFKESLVEFVNAKLGIKKEKVPEWGRNLTKYANHDTTERLNRLIEMEEKEHEGAQTMRDTLVKMSYVLENMERNGIKCRKE